MQERAIDGVKQQYIGGRVMQRCLVDHMACWYTVDARTRNSVQHDAEVSRERGKLMIRCVWRDEQRKLHRVHDGVNKLGKRLLEEAHVESRVVNDEQKIREDGPN